jgi:hypothetical protein
MLYFKSLSINDVALCQRMLRFVLNFKWLVINVVALVVLYMRILHSHCAYPCPNFFDFSVAARTAFITVARNLPFSSSCRPSMVVPPGLVT